MSRYLPDPYHGNGNGNGADPALLASAPDPVDEGGLDLREMIAPLRRQIWVVLGVAALVFVAVGFRVMTSAPRYQANALVRLKDVRGAMTAGLGGEALTDMVLGRTTNPVLSEVQVLNSRTVLGRAVDDLGLRLRPRTGGFLAAHLAQVTVDSAAPVDTLVVRFTETGVQVAGGAGEASARYGEPVVLHGIGFAVTERPEELDEATLVVIPRAAAVDSLRRGLGAQIRPETDVVEVVYTAGSPQHAQRVLDAVVRSFHRANMASAQQQSRLRRVFIEEQLASTDSMVLQAQVALSNFRRRETAFSAAEKFAAEQQALTGLDVRREELDAERRIFQSLLSVLARAEGVEREAALRTLISSPQMAQNPIIAPTYAQIARYQSVRDSLTGGDWSIRETHPDVVRINAQIRAAEARLVGAGRSQMEVLQARIQALDDLKARSMSAMQALPDAEAEEVRLGLQLATMQKISEQLREEYQKARIEEVVELGQVEIVDAASLPVEPLPDRRTIKLGLGLIMGLMLGAGTALLRDHLNRSIQRKDEMEGLLQVPGLAVIPQIATRAGAQRHRLPIRIFGNGEKGAEAGRALEAASGLSELVTVSDLRSSSSEAYRTLRTNLIFSQAIQSIRTLVVTSSTPTEGKTTTAANLAITFAQQGMKVLLVDCDLRKARLHQVFGVAREPGLSQLVLGYTDVASALRDTPVPGLQLLPAGTPPPNPSELVGGERLREVLGELQQQFEMIILDTPPLLAAADAAMLGKFSDGVLLVVRAGHTDRTAAQQAMQQLRTVGARVLGAVLNDPDAKVAGYGGYYTSYGYYGVEA